MKILFSWMWITKPFCSLRYLEKAWPFLFIQMLDMFKVENTRLIICSGCKRLNVENTSSFSFLKIPGKSSTFFVSSDMEDVKSGKYSTFFVPSDTWDVKSEMAGRYMHSPLLHHVLLSFWMCTKGSTTSLKSHTPSMKSVEIVLLSKISVNLAIAA